MYVFPIVVSALIGLVHFLGEEMSEHVEKFHVKLLSLGRRLMVATFFLEMLPQIDLGQTFLGEYIYMALLLGFVLVHLAE